jgi:hypothetical protein
MTVQTVSTSLVQVRSMERVVASVCRAVALDVAKATADGTVTSDEVCF